MGKEIVHNQHSQKLIQCLANLANDDDKMNAKIQLVSFAGTLLPNGNPAFRDIINFPTITKLISEYGKSHIMKIVFLLVKDLCNSVNVVRNMSEDQMIEAAGMLIDECDNLRLEDYIMMFTLGKRGQLVKIMDRMDIDIISKMLDSYWQMRYEAGQRIYEQEIYADNNRWKDKRLGQITPEEKEKMTPEEKEKSDRFGRLIGIMKAWDEEEKLKVKKYTETGCDKLVSLLKTMDALNHYLDARNLYSKRNKRKK